MSIGEIAKAGLQAEVYYGTFGGGNHRQNGVFGIPGVLRPPLPPEQNGRLSHAPMGQNKSGFIFRPISDPGGRGGGAL